MRYSIYQIQLSNTQIDRVNAGQEVPEFHAKMTSMLGNPRLGLEMDLYRKVAEIEANDLEGVFHIGNMGPEHKITRISRMHSVSVGDIVEDPNGQRHVVASIGFDLIAA